MTSANPQDGSTDRTKWWRSISITTLSTLATILAAGMYLVLSDIYRRFYRNLDTRPEDVGLDRLAILGRSLGLIVVITAAIVALLILISPIFYYMRDEVPADSPWGWLAIMGLFLLIASPFFGIRALFNSDALENRIAAIDQGHEVTPVKLLGLEVLDLQARKARIEPLDGSKRMPRLLSDLRLLYLGHDGSSGLFAACGSTVRISLNDIAVELIGASQPEVSDEDRKTFCDSVKK